MTDTTLNESLRSAERSPEFVAESLALEFISEVWRLMQDRDIKQKDLATLLEKKPAFVSRVLAGPHNLTLQTIAEFLVALDRRPSFRFESLDKDVKPESREFRQGCTVIDLPKRFRAPVVQSEAANYEFYQVAAPCIRP